MTEDELEARVDDLEAEATKLAGGGLLVAAVGLLGVLTVLWSVYGLSFEFRIRLASILNDLPEPGRGEQVVPVLVAAATLGASIAPSQGGDPVVPQAAIGEVLGIPARVSARLARARTLAITIEDFDDVVAVAAGVRQAALAAARSARWAVNRTVADALTVELNRLGHDRAWVAEPDACPRCLALHGQVVGPGEVFTAVVDERPFILPNPPAHYNCRCRVWPA